MKSVFENLAVRRKRTAPESTPDADSSNTKPTNQMSSGEYEAALRRNPSLRHEIDNGSSAVRHIDLSKPSGSERYAVLRPCASCGKDVAVAPEDQGPAFCSDKCQKTLQAEDERIRTALIKFAESTPDFYRCPHNTAQLVEAWHQQPFEWNVSNLKAVFARLRREGKILPNITMKDIQKMSTDEYEIRLRLDPDLGGHKKAIEESARPVETATPGFEPGNRLGALQRAAENERKAQSANYASRYSGADSFVNGVRVEAPGTPEGGVAYRNGRRVG